MYSEQTSNICISGIVEPIKYEYLSGLDDLYRKRDTSFHCASSFFVNTVLNHFEESSRDLIFKEEDDSPKKVYKNFCIDDFKYSEVAKRNLKILFEKRKIKNKDECITIVEELSPEGVEIFVEKYVYRRVKTSILKTLRKIKASDVIAVAYDAA